MFEARGVNIRKAKYTLKTRYFFEKLHRVEDNGECSLSIRGYSPPPREV